MDETRVIISIQKMSRAVGVQYKNLPWTEVKPFLFPNLQVVSLRTAYALVLPPLGAQWPCICTGAAVVIVHGRGRHGWGECMMMIFPSRLSASATTKQQDDTIVT